MTARSSIPSRRHRAADPRPLPFDLVTRRGRRSPALAFRVKSGGDAFYLSGLQRASLLWITGQASRGRHHWRIRDLAAAVACSPGAASKVYRRLRSLSLIGGPAPLRGRNGHAITWLPTVRSQSRDAASRRASWPTYGNDSTLTTFGGYLSRAGAARGWARRSGSPPGARPPGGGAARPSTPRARGRDWPPAYVDETCPVTRRVGRLRRSAVIRAAGDVGVVYGGRCPRCRRAHVASITFVAPGPGSARRPGDRYPTPAQQAIAADLLGGLDAGLGDVVRERYLGWIRTPVYAPPLPDLVDGPLEDLAELVDVARRAVVAELAAVASTRQLIAPPADPR